MRERQRERGRQTEEGGGRWNGGRDGRVQLEARIAWNHWKLEETRKGFSSVFGESTALRTAEFWAFGFQNCGGIHFCSAWQPSRTDTLFPWAAVTKYRTLGA